MILDEIVAATRERVLMDKFSTSPKKMKKMAELMPMSTPFIFEKTLRKPGIHFICEVKKASPSKGIIAKEFPYKLIAKEYEEAGADCISVLTEPDFFQGKNEYLTEIKKIVGIPVLRKDFIIDEYQIYQAKVIGADCVLLICSILSQELLVKFLSICKELSISAIVEAHSEEEVVMAVQAGARIIGVNNRNLKDFTVDIHNSIRLRSLVPEDILFVAESGIYEADQVQQLREAKVNAVLIGETLMKAADKKAMLSQLKGACE